MMDRKFIQEWRGECRDVTATSECMVAACLSKNSAKPSRGFSEGPQRALGPGGRVSIATWRSLAEMPFFHELHLVAERHPGTVIDQRHSFPDRHALESLFTDAGFANVAVDTVTHTVHFDDDTRFARLNAMAIIGMSESGKGMTDLQKQETAAVIASESGGVLSRYAHDSGISFTLTTNVLSGQAA